MMKKLRRAQTMVEYIIIIALIAISLIAVFTYLSKAIGKKAAGATAELDDDAGSKAKAAVEKIEDPDDPKTIKQLGN